MLNFCIDQSAICYVTNELSRISGAILFPRHFLYACHRFLNTDCQTADGSC